MVELFIFRYSEVEKPVRYSFYFATPYRKVTSNKHKMFKAAQQHMIPSITSKQHLHHSQNDFQQQNQPTTNSANQLVSKTVQQNQLQTIYGIY